MNYENAMRQTQRINIYRQANGLDSLIRTSQIRICAAEWEKLTPQGRRWVARAALFYYNALRSCTASPERAWCRAMEYLRQMILCGGVR